MVQEENEFKEVVFEVCSKCSQCGSVLRAYDKNSKQTRCYKCNKKQPNSRIDIESLPFEPNPPDLSYLEEKITLTNLHPFHSQGLSCRCCGSKNEMLWIEGKTVYLICADCKKDKGKEPFIEGKLLIEK